jgi:predicted dehydrogenase
MKPTNVAVIGCGYWGINYIRVFSELPDIKVVMVSDSNEERLRVVRERFPLIPTTANWQDILVNRWVDAVVIATPASSHFKIAKELLRGGKHLLVEKPMTTTVEDAQELVGVAEQHSRILMVGHTFLYNSGIQKVKQLMSTGDFGRVYYLHAARTNMGPVRHDVNALWDLAGHDVAIFNYLLDRQPCWVSAVASKVLGNDREDVVFATLNYSDHVIANIHVSWVDPNKVREVVVVGSQRRIVFNDLNNVERVRIFEKGIAPEMEAGSFGEYRLLVRDGDIISPHVEASEPLKNQSSHFLECIHSGTRPNTDGQSGVQVVRVLCALSDSVALNGVPVSLDQETLAKAVA